MTIGREPIQYLEWGLNVCSLTYGDAWKVPFDEADFTNGDSGYWTKGAGWTVTTGSATRTNVGAVSDLFAQATATIGKEYEITFTLVNRTSGTVRPQIGGTDTGSSVSADGTYTQTIEATVAGQFTLRANGPFAGEITDFQVKEIGSCSARLADISPQVPFDETDFSNGDSGFWAYDAGWTISVGDATKVATPGSPADLVISGFTTEIGKRYEVTFTLDNFVAGNVLTQIGGVDFGTNVNVNGTYTETLTATVAGDVGVRGGGGFAGSITYMQVRELSEVNPRKCFNTFLTCQDQDNYDRTTKTLRFSDNRDGIYRDSTLTYPALQSVSVNPTEITLGGTDDRLGTFGKRARVNVKLLDFIGNDVDIDPYYAERVSGEAQFDGVGYEPNDRGSFFGKLLARYRYTFKNIVEVKNGFVGENPASITGQKYIITETAGPTASGAVSITLQDPLKLTDKKNAVCPKASNGLIGIDITDTDTEFDLIPEGIGDEMYPASGTGALGQEIVRYTRSGDTITLTNRGVDGSTKASHSRNDTFQDCYRVENETLDVVARDLLVNYAGIDPTFIDDAEWADEVGTWLASLRLTITIAKTTPVIKLMSQLADFGVIFWWADRQSKIRLLCNRPVDLDEVVTDVTDASNIVEGTGDVARLDKQRLSRVFFNHGVIDYGKSLTNEDNYKKVLAAVALPSEGENEYGQEANHTITSPWLGNAGDDTQADASASRLLNRFRDVPLQFMCKLDHKDWDALDTASVIKISSNLIQDLIGDNIETFMQITHISEPVPGSEVSIKAQTFTFFGRYGRYMDRDTASADYNSATDEEKATGCFMTDRDNPGFDDGTGPYIMY